MALVTEKPAELKPQNDLNNIADDLLGPVPVMIRHSNRDLFVMDHPPGDDDWIKVEYTFRSGDLIRKKPDSDGAVKYVRLMEFLGAKLTVEPYKPEPADDTPPPPEDDDPSLIDRDGNIPDDYDGDEAQAETPSGLDEFDPEFSHNGTQR
jgi:hypothetical protein